jgi:hypothetical protein
MHDDRVSVASEHDYALICIAPFSSPRCGAIGVWMFLVTGIGWLVISLIVLRFRLASVVAVGVLMGVVFLGDLDLLARDQPRLVAGHDRGRPGDPARLLGLQQEFPARALLLLIWVRFFALFRGFSDILLAFEVRGLQSK